jgi:nucleoid-associated protein YgaU
VNHGQLLPPYAAANTGLKYGFISNNVTGFIEAVERFSKTNVLASPRVLVLNKQRAEIQLGQRLGYRNTVTNLTSSLQTVEFLSVGTLLSLRPYVSNDGMIRMEIHPEKSTGMLDDDGVPQTNTSEVTTNILIPDGATIVIGGLMDDQDEIVEEGVPGLSRIPVLGAAFRTRRTRTQKSELIVLLTPRIVTRGGLPEPQPGLPPRGEMGVPNSGPMPGPSYRTAGGLPTMLPDEHDGLGIEGVMPDVETYAVPGAPSMLPEALSFPEPPAIDPESATPPPPDPALAPFRGVTTSAVGPGGAAAEADPGLIRTSAIVALEGGTTEAGSDFRHRLRAGEDLRSVSRYYYGTDAHADALWRLNRDVVPDPAAIRPGVALRIPPAQVFSRKARGATGPVGLERIGLVRREGGSLAGRLAAWRARPSARAPREEAPATDTAVARTGLPNLLRYQELRSWPVPPGASAREAMRQGPGGVQPGLLARWREGSRSKGTQPARVVGASREMEAPTVARVRPRLGDLLFGHGPAADRGGSER